MGEVMDELRLIQRIRREVAGLTKYEASYSEYANPPWDCSRVKTVIAAGYIWPSHVNWILDKIQDEILSGEMEGDGE